MPENDLAKPVPAAAAIDHSPLTVKADDTLQQVMVAMATAGKTYALVERGGTLVGIFSYDNAAQAAGNQVDFSQTPAQQWLTSLDQLQVLDDSLACPLVFDSPPSDQPEHFYLPVVDQGHHWMGLLRHGELYTVVSASDQLNGYTAKLTVCHSTAALFQQQQERLALALTGAQMGTWDWDLSQGAILVSEGQERLLGLAPGEFDGSYDSLFTHLHADDQATVYQALQHAIRHGQRYEIEFRVCLQGDRMRWLSARGQVFDSGQQAPRLAGVTLDITQQKRAEAEIKLQSQRERLVTEIAQRIRHLLDLDSILAQTVSSVQEFIEADRVIVIQCGPDMGGEVIQEACAPGYPSMLGWSLRDPWSVSETFLSHYRAGRGLAVEDIYAQNLPPSHLRFLEYFQIQAEIVVPLLQDQTLWGLLIAHQCRSPRAWRTSDVRLLQSLSTQVGIAIQQAKLHKALTLANQRLRRMAYLDGLTQVANRRRFEQHLDQEWRRMSREQGSLAVIMADIDCFKGFNDRYGHQAGDNCLQLVARTLSRAAKRPGDLVARYGGEEFVIVLPHTDLKGAESVAEEIRLLVRSQHIPHAESTVAKVVTMSLGVASTIPHPAPQGEEGSAALVKRADKALYRAKEEGRDQVRLAL